MAQAAAEREERERFLRLAWRYEKMAMEKQSPR
jgi:hypothetical protein